jgi:hypothetical protein
MYRCFLTGLLLFRSASEDSALFASQRFRFPASHPDDVSSRPDDVVFRLDTPMYREASIPACIRPDDSAARSDDPQCSIKLQIFFPKSKYGKIVATV